MTGALDRSSIQEWCAGVDAGPYSSLAVGERITYRNTEMFTLLAAAAALTERVAIVSTLVVLPMHSEVLVAKQLATIDVISGGRLIVGLGVGGRDEDYNAVGASFARRHQRLDDQVDRVREVWAGDSVPAVGPAPFEGRTPTLWSGSMGPKAIARAAHWADAIAGFTFGPTVEEVTAAFTTADEAWDNAGRPRRPHRVTSFWYSVAPDGPDRLDSYARHYLGVFGAELAADLAATCHCDTQERLDRALDEMEAAGCDEVILVPTSADLEELTRTTEVVAARKP